LKLKFKANGDIDKYKARSCGRGDQLQQLLSHVETFSPTISDETFLLLMQLSIIYEWVSFNIDTVSAFLHQIRPPSATKIYTRIDKKICEICKVNKDDRILEIGFGEGDFLIYIRDNYGNSPVGVSISEEQVNLANSRGFETHKLNMWDITPEQLGKFDLILQCGNVEYTRCVGEPDDKYTDYFKLVQKLLKPDGKYFITCIHGRTYDYIDDYRLYDYSQAYVLLFGNDGAYPGGRFHLTKHA
jgi:hypothetical protein